MGEGSGGGGGGNWGKGGGNWEWGTPLSTPSIFARKFCRVCPGSKGYQLTTLVADD